MPLQPPSSSPIVPPHRKPRKAGFSSREQPSRLPITTPPPKKQPNVVSRGKPFHHDKEAITLLFRRQRRLAHRRDRCSVREWEERPAIAEKRARSARFESGGLSASRAARTRSGEAISFPARQDPARAIFPLEIGVVRSVVPNGPRGTAIVRAFVRCSRPTPWDRRL